jgi:Uncharacterized Fe-S center protein
MPLVRMWAFWPLPTPVALDQACFDLVSKAPSLGQEASPQTVADKFSARWPHTCGQVQLSYGESLGLGNREYKLKKI